MPVEFKSINTGSISAGGNVSKEWTPDKDITVKKFLIIERDDKSLSNVQAYITLAGEPITKDFIPATVIGQDPEYCYKPEKKVPKGQKIYVKLTNNRSDSINCDLVWEYE